MKGLFQCPPWARGFCPFRACGAYLRKKNEQIMIEDRSYGKAELAMLYFPTATPRVALNRLVRWINRCPELKQSLCSGCAGKFSHFYTRQQVAEIIEFLDEP